MGQTISMTDRYFKACADGDDNDGDDGVDDGDSDGVDDDRDEGGNDSDGVYAGDDLMVLVMVVMLRIVVY